MAGLLDPMDDPRTMGLLSLGMGLLGSRGSFGQGLAQAGPMALQAMQQAKMQQQQRAQEQQRQALQALQMQQAQMALEQAKAAQAKQSGVEAAYRGALRTPEQMAMAGGGGPTVANAGRISGSMPQIDQAALLRGLTQADPMAAYQMLHPKPEDVRVVGDTLVGLSGGKARELYRAPEKQSLNDLIVRGPDGKPTLNTLLLEAKRQIARDGAARTSVSVDAGPKAFWGDIGKLAADDLFKGRESAQAAAGVLQSVQQIRQAVSGGAYQGTGAELKLNAAKALGAIGMPYDAQTVANTEVFNAQANKFVLDSIKQLGANPSNADREFIEKTVPRLSTDPAALPRLLTFLEGKAQQQIRAYNQRAQKVGSQPNAQFLPFDLSVQEPESRVIDFGSLR